MKVYFKNDKLPKINNAVVTIGTFDGVHQGHQIILKRVKEIATRLEGESVLITFDPHPRHIIQPDNTDIKLITSLDEKLKLLHSFGIDHVQVVNFNREFSMISAIAYVKDFIVGQWSPKIIVIGYDHKFGQNRSGDIHLLKTMATEYEFEIEEIEEQLINDITVSSTQVRKDLLEGNIQHANKLLGHPFQITGTVVKGDQLGKTIGFPTANIQLAEPNKLIPGSGVFITKVKHKDDWYNGMLNIGYRPTISGTHKTIEVYILEFDEMIYGEPLTLELVQKIREEQKFNNLDELKQQLQKDKQSVLNYLNQ